MAIIKGSANRQVDYVQAAFSTSARAPLGFSLADATYENFTPVPGIGGTIKHISVRTSAAGDSDMEKCTIFFEDEGEERGTALQFATGGPMGYSFTAGHLVAKLMACDPRDPVEFYAYVFAKGTTGTNRENKPYVRKTDELAIVLKQNGHKITHPMWGLDDDDKPLERGPDAPFLVDSKGNETKTRDFSQAREWMVNALSTLKMVYNRQRQSEQNEERPITVDELPSDFYNQESADPAHSDPGYSQRQR